MNKEHNAEKDAHHCDVPRCDGTRLGHDLAAEFPEETARFDAAMDDLRTAEEDAPAVSWFREALAAAKARNAATPEHARMIVTNPTLSAHTRVTPPGKP